MPQPIEFTGDDNETMTIPARFEVCWRCEGEGSHDTIGAMTADEFHEHGEEFAVDYFAGRYDKPCEECKGERVLRVPDEERATPEQLAEYRRQAQAEADFRAERAAEIAAGC